MSRSRGGVGSSNRPRFSKRVASGAVSVERILCPFCGHHKAFLKPRGLFCSRCKRRNDS